MQGPSCLARIYMAQPQSWVPAALLFSKSTQTPAVEWVRRKSPKRGQQTGASENSKPHSKTPPSLLPPQTRGTFDKSNPWRVIAARRIRYVHAFDPVQKDRRATIYIYLAYSELGRFILAASSPQNLLGERFIGFGPLIIRPYQSLCCVGTFETIFCFFSQFMGFLRGMNEWMNECIQAFLRQWLFRLLGRLQGFARCRKMHANYWR